MKPLQEMRVSRERLSEQVANQLRELVMSRELKPGDRLPSERELAEHLGISRAIVREAIKTLEQQGLLSVEVGRGTFVTQLEPQDLTHALNLLMLQSADEHAFDYVYEIRQMIEIESARKAAERATDDDIAELESKLQAMVASVDDVDGFARADTAYHQALAVATHNPLFVTLLLPITNLLRQIQRKASRTMRGPADAIHYHTRILEAVRQHNPDASGQAMREHLISVLQHLSSASKADNDGTHTS
ncbi:MAG: FadR family transcriptional regulator [Anaerolineae bacterium]|nr:FadR family transcriptional regulator [Anaerolineae bacterium]